MAKIKFWRTPVFVLMDKYQRWRRVAEILKLPRVAKLRLEWIIYYHQGANATETARHFGVSRKTFLLHLKECEFRYNHKDGMLNILKKIINR